MDPTQEVQRQCLRRSTACSQCGQGSSTGHQCRNLVHTADRQYSRGDIVSVLPMWDPFSIYPTPERTIAVRFIDELYTGQVQPLTIHIGAHEWLRFGLDVVRHLLRVYAHHVYYRRHRLWPFAPSLTTRARDREVKATRTLLNLE